MKAALLIVLSLSALAMASPAINKNTNQIEVGSTQYVQAKAYGANTAGDYKQTPVSEQLKQWCFASSKSQTELTASFKKLVSLVESQPEDQATEEVVMSERICSSAFKTAEQQQQQQQQVDPMAHELIKDVYMDALLACDKRECSKQLMKVVDSEDVDSIRASYYMTRIALQDKQTIQKDDQEIKQFVETYINQQQQQQQQTSSEAVERQKLFAATSLLGKALDKHPESQELNKLAQQLAKTIADRYIKTVTIDEVKSYKQQPTNPELAKRIAKRSAALKALANLPSFIVKEVKEIEQLLIKIAHQKEELVTVRQSAIECLEQNEQVMEELKELTFDQEEPIEVRVAAYRALMTAPFAGGKQEQVKQQLAAQIVDQIVKHCEQKQQQDDQFVVYAVSYLNNLRSSQQPEHQAVRDVIAKSKQHSMQIQLLAKKLKQQLKDIRQWSRNYKLEQEFAQLDSGLIVEGDLIYESKQKQHQQWNILPKVIRVNMSMPVMGETVNVLEITLRQDQMDQELVEALKLVQSAKFNSETVTKVVDSFKNSVEQSKKNSNSNKIAEADLTIKCEGQTIVYITCDDFRYATATEQHSQRNTRSVNDYYYSSSSIIEKMLEHLKRQPVNFNRGFNFNFNDRLAKVLDVDASVIAGLRFESRVLSQQARPDDFEVVARIEPRFAFEAVVGPSKMSQKKLLQRLSSKSALGLRYRYKQGELVDMQIDLPMNSMELFTFETQMVEKINDSYNYSADSVYGQQDIYSPDEEFLRYNTYNSYNTFSNNKQQQQQQLLNQEDDSYPSVIAKRSMMKRSIFAQENKSTLVKMIQNKRAFARSMETPEEVARATGLRGKLRLMASPKDCQYLVQVIVQKYEPTMQGYRFQIQKTQQDQYQVAITAPGSRVQRQLIVRLQKQINQQRAIVKVEVQSAKMNSAAQWEIIYDGRQYAIKSMIVATNVQGKQQWRHQLELGCQRGQNTAKTATVAYKPYLVLESTSMKRPIQMQGLVAIQQQEPKTVITYEFKSPINTQDSIQGKLVIDSRKTTTTTGFNKRTTSYRRSMQSPVELLLNQDWTIVSDFVGQVSEHSAKVHQMIDWSMAKMSLQAELAVQHKNLRKQIDQQIVASLKVDEQQQMLSVQRKCPQVERNDFRLTLTSDLSHPSQHVFLVEGRYQDKRGQQQLVAYKHKLDYQLMMKQQKLELAYQTELTCTKYNMEEKFQGRSELSWSPKGPKVVKADISSTSRPVQAKFELVFVSFEQHQILFQVQQSDKQQFQHRTTVHSDRRQYQLVSRTDKKNQLVAKTVFEMDRQLGEAQVNIEMPQQQLHLVADLKLNKSGRQSSIALQSARFAGKTEFSFMPTTTSSATNWMLPIQSFRVKSDLKDLMNKDAYWMDSQVFPHEPTTKSYFRADSPLYRAELEFDPRDYSTKLASFARSKKPVEQQLYSTTFDNDDTTANTFDFDSKMNLANKIWMVRSLVQSPKQLEQLKQQARRALFEYADQRQQQKHQLNWSPVDQRVSFAFDRQPIDTSRGYQQLKPMHLAGDLHTSLFQMPATAAAVRPSNLKMQSEWADVDAEVMPFDGETCYAKLSALSRNRRSAFKKHESEVRYQKHQGYKAWMKHQDSKDRRHQWQIEADESPKKWAKLSMDSDKHGKVDYEHKWHKLVAKRSPRHPSAATEDVFSNSVSFQRQPIDQDQDWSHSTQFSWQEPCRYAATTDRVRRSIFVNNDDEENDDDQTFDYSPIDYLKRVSGHLQSQTRLPNSQLYDIDFDYRPIDKYSRLNVAMPGDMIHQSEIEYLPSERLYKLQSKLYNSRNQQQVPEYQLTATTKPVWAQHEEEQLIAAGNYQHQPLIKLFRQPIKFDYNDKSGRVARLDYDLYNGPKSTIAGGLRKKRAALHFRDAAKDFEHNSSFHFYPEQVFANIASRRPHAGDFVVKADTKYGPIVMHADTTEQNTIELSLDSPLMQAKLSAEISPVKRNAQIVKLQLDNKQKTASLYKLVRNSPVLADCRMVQQWAQKFDQSRFEHQTEMLVSFVDTIFKINSQTMINKRPVMMIEGQLDQQQNKAYIKFNGADRVQGQLMVDLVKQAMQLVVDGDDKRTFSHQTRLVRVSDKFFSLDSMTSHKQQPLFKLSGKVSSTIFEEPEHLFSSGRRMQSHEEHVSTFEAVIYEPKEYQISGQYDCLEKEARVILKDTETNKVQDLRLQFDQQKEIINVDARQVTPRGISYSIQKSINVAPFIGVN